MKVRNAAPMMRSHSGSSGAKPAPAADRFFVFDKESPCTGTISYLTWYVVVPQEPLCVWRFDVRRRPAGRGVMVVDEQKLERKPAADLGRRDVLALAGAAAAVGLAAGPALAQSQPAAAATAATQPQTKPTVVLDRPVRGVLLIGIDRIDAQNRIDIPTFSAIGQAYYQFEHDDDLKVAVLHGKGPDFSQGLDQASWGSALRNGPFQTPQNFIDPVATAGPERSKPLVVAVQGHVTRVAHELFLAADLRIAAQDAVLTAGSTGRRNTGIKSLVGGAAATWPLAALAQQKERVYRIGYL